jgi:hypothetical protein
MLRLMGNCGLRNAELRALTAVERRLNPARGTAVVPLVAGMALEGLAGFARS